MAITRKGGRGLSAKINSPIPARLAAAQANGIVALNAREINAMAEVARLTGQRGPEVVIEATGNPAVVPLCLELVGRGGSVVLLGSTRGRVEIDAYSHIHIYETLAQNPPAYLGVLIDWQRNHV